MREKRLKQESRLPAFSRPPAGVVNGLGSIEIGPGLYSCCQCGVPVPLNEAYRRSDACSFGSLFCAACGMQVSRLYNLAISPVVLRAEERLNALVESGARGKDVPPLSALGFVPPNKSEVGEPADIVEVDDADMVEVE